MTRATRLSEKPTLLDWAHVRAEFDWAYEGLVAPEFRETIIHHPGMSAFLVRRGSVLIQTSKGSVTGKPGQWILPTLGRRLQRFSPDTRLLSIHLNLSWPGGLPLFDWDVAARFDASQVPRLETESVGLRRQVDKEFPHGRNELMKMPGSLSAHFRLYRYFAAWLSTLIDTLLGLGWTPSRLGAIDPRIMRVVQAIDSLPLRSLFKEMDLAKNVRLSVSQLNRLFTKQFGVTPRRYFEKRRLEQAHVSLRCARSVKEAAYELGFSSPQHFSTWFRKQAGTTPTAFQERYWAGSPKLAAALDNQSISDSA